jgi:hypothetical protein
MKGRIWNTLNFFYLCVSFDVNKHKVFQGNSCENLDLRPMIIES